MAEERPILGDGERYTTHIEPLQRGGGEKYDPQSVEDARRNLLPQAQALSQQTRGIPEALRGPRTVFLATLLPNYLANAYFPSRLVRELDLVALGSRRASGTLRTRTTVREGAPTKTLIFAGSERSFEQLVLLLGNDVLATSREQAREDLREFDELRLPTTDDVVSGINRVPGMAEPLLLEAVLHPDPGGGGTGRRPIDDETFAKWERLVQEHGGRVRSDYRRTVGGLTFVPIRLPAQGINQVAAFNPLRSLRPMPQMRPIPQILRGATAAPPPHALGTQPSRAQPVAVFDGGVDVSSDYFSPFVRETDLTGRPADPGAQLHGSLVTSALLYGHLEDGDGLTMPAAPVDHYRVFPLRDPTSDVELYELLDQIVSTVSGSSYDIVNLSLGPAEAVEDAAEPSRWTAELDTVAYEHRTVFVTAAGNNGLGDAATGLNRVQIPGDMVNGLAIGASNVPEPEEPWDRAAYSAVGPGRPGSRLQPAGVVFGGTNSRRFKGIFGAGERLANWGTSFSAPTVARSLAALSGRLGRMADSNTLRAFAAHFAVDCDPPRPTEVGHGRLQSNYVNVLDCAPQATTVLFRGEAERGRVDRLVIPYPDGVERRGLVKIRWTLAFASPTDPTEAAEYTKAGLELLFRPNASIHSLTIDNRTTTIDIRQDVEAVSEALSQGATLSLHPKTEAGRGGPEVQRREDGKWETLRRQSIRMQARRLYRPTLDVVYYAREGGVLVTDAPPVPYSVLVTIEAADGVSLYDRVRSEFQLLAPIRVEARAPVRVRSS